MYTAVYNYTVNIPVVGIKYSIKKYSIQRKAGKGGKDTKTKGQRENKQQESRNTHIQTCTKLH